MKNIIERAKALRAFIEHMADSVTDGEAFSYPEVFAPWKVGVKYKTGGRLSYDGFVYKVLQDHTSSAEWTPDTAVSLYVKIPDPAVEWPEWEQPTGAHDAYAKWAKCSHNNKHWISIIDANIYEPGVYGWEEA